MSITITVPNDDHVALRAMAKALEEIAVARGAPLRVNLVTQEMLDKLENGPGGHIFCEPEVDNTSQQYESLQEELRKKHIETVTTPFIDTDSNGTPWDERIHSASKALNADGSWRLRRKPKGMDDEEWSFYVQEVSNAVKNGYPEEPLVTYSVNNNEPAVTPAGDDFHVDAGEVTEQEVAAIPAPPLPVPALPSDGVRPDFDDDIPYTPSNTISPALERLAGQQSTMTFPQVMQFLTERHGRITSAQVDQVIADMGLNSIMDLNTQPEHAGPFVARVKALLGE